MSAHKNFLHTSDFVNYSTILAGFILEFFAPTRLPIDRIVAIFVGVSLLVLAWTIIIVAKLQFKRHQQKTGPGNETTHLIKNGLFKYSRNPIYLGVVFIIPGLGFIFNSLWMIILTVLAIGLINYLLIKPEEKYLLNKFGEEYSIYCKNVRKWI
jgi:protein-S-isoprenylcysteine O-methyltransferase Ste14